jgi:hypothetical protein
MNVCLLCAYQFGAERREKPNCSANSLLKLFRDDSVGLLRSREVEMRIKSGRINSYAILLVQVEKWLVEVEEL